MNSIKINTGAKIKNWFGPPAKSDLVPVFLKK